MRWDGMGWDVFNVGRATQWAFVDGLGVNPKVDPEIFGLTIFILRQVTLVMNTRCFTSIQTKFFFVTLTLMKIFYWKFPKVLVLFIWSMMILLKVLKYTTICSVILYALSRHSKRTTVHLRIVRRRRQPRGEHLIMSPHKI